jgi:hypothetical protein
MTLLELQRRMAAAIMVPHTSSARIAASVAPRHSIRAEANLLLKPNSRLSSMERLEIYRRSYWFRLLDSLREDFPGLCAILGPRLFSRLSEAYLTDSPSRSFTLRNLGARLEEWLQNHSAYGGTHPTLAMDMVRLEWAHIEAFDGEQRKALGPEELLEVGPDMKFGLQPHISLLELSYPVDDLRIQIQDVTAGKNAESNTVTRRRERVAVRSYKAIDPTPTFLAVHRLEFAVYYKRLDPGEFRILKALHQGSPLGEALDTIAESASSMVEGWFATWSRLGWLCSPERKAA